MAKPVIKSVKGTGVLVSGKKFTLKCFAVGEELSYQWEVNNGYGWKPVLGNDCDCLELNVLLSMHKTMYRCVVASGAESSVSSITELLVKAEEPKAQEVKSKRKVIRRKSRKAAATEEKAVEPLKEDGAFLEILSETGSDFDQADEVVKAVIKKMPESLKE